jgi:hypothetical protein
LTSYPLRPSGFAHHHGFVPRLCRPYRAKTKGKVERFIRYLRASFYLPLASQLNPEGLKVDRDTANARGSAADAGSRAASGPLPSSHASRGQRPQVADHLRDKSDTGRTTRLCA